MRRIGIVASGSTVLDAGVILAEGEERIVKAEDLVLVKNRNGNKHFYKGEPLIFFRFSSPDPHGSCV